MLNTITPLYDGIIGSKENIEIFKILGNYSLEGAGTNPFIYNIDDNTFTIESGTFIWHGVLYQIIVPISKIISNGYVYIYEFGGQIEIDIKPSLIEDNPELVLLGNINDYIFTQIIETVNYDLNNLAKLFPQVDDIDSRVNVLEEDTGWRNIAYDSGWSGGTGGQLQYRKINNQVFLRGGVGQTITPDGIYKTVSTGGLPIGIRPPTEVRVTGMGGSGRPIGWRITVTGNIDVINQSTNTATTWASVFCSWLIG